MLNIVREVKNRVIVTDPGERMTTRSCLVSQERIVLLIDRPGKRSKFKVQFLLNVLHFCIIGEVEKL